MAQVTDDSIRNGDAPITGNALLDLAFRYELQALSREELLQSEAHAAGCEQCRAAISVISDLLKNSLFTGIAKRKAYG